MYETKDDHAFPVLLSWSFHGEWERGNRLNRRLERIVRKNGRVCQGPTYNERLHVFKGTFSRIFKHVLLNFRGGIVSRINVHFDPQRDERWKFAKPSCLESTETLV